MGRFTGHSEKWGTYIEPKRYASYKLPKNLKNKTILIGSVTDAYNPVEKKYELMPAVLKTLSEYEAHVEVLTKSSLILRDIDLLKSIPGISVGISLSNLNDNDNRLIEPGASSAKERIHTFQELHKEGIKTYLFIVSYLPDITNLQELYNALEGAIDYMAVENLNLRGSYKATILALIHDLHPKVYDLWNDIYVRKNADKYWKGIENQIYAMRQELPIPMVSYLYYEKTKKS